MFSDVRGCDEAKEELQEVGGADVGGHTACGEEVAAGRGQAGLVAQGDVRNLSKLSLAVASTGPDLSDMFVERDMVFQSCKKTE